MSSLCLPLSVPTSTHRSVPLTFLLTVRQVSLSGDPLFSHTWLFAFFRPFRQHISQCFTFEMAHLIWSVSPRIISLLLTSKSTDGHLIKGKLSYRIPGSCSHWKRGDPQGAYIRVWEPWRPLSILPVTDRYQLWLHISYESVDYSSLPKQRGDLVHGGQTDSRATTAIKACKFLSSPIICEFNIISQLTRFIEPHLIMRVTIGTVVEHKLDPSSKTFLIRKKCHLASKFS